MRQLQEITKTVPVIPVAQVEARLQQPVVRRAVELQQRGPGVHDGKWQTAGFEPRHVHGHEHGRLPGSNADASHVDAIEACVQDRGVLQLSLLEGIGETLERGGG